MERRQLQPLCEFYLNVRILNQVATREIGKAEFEASRSSGRVGGCKRRNEARLRLWQKGRGAGLKRAPPPRPLTTATPGDGQRPGCRSRRPERPQSLSAPRGGFKRRKAALQRQLICEGTDRIQSYISFIASASDASSPPKSGRAYPSLGRGRAGSIPARPPF